MRTPQDSVFLEALTEYYKLIKKYEKINMGTNLPVPTIQNLPALMSNVHHDHPMIIRLKCT